MKDFKLSCIQVASGPNIEANFLEISKHIVAAKKLGADLIVLPENFSMMAKEDSLYLDIKEDLGQGRIQNFISNKARKHNLWIVAGTIPIKSQLKAIPKSYTHHTWFLILACINACLSMLLCMNFYN